MWTPELLVCMCSRKDEVVNCRWFLPCHKNTKHRKKEEEEGLNQQTGFYKSESVYTCF